MNSIIDFFSNLSTPAIIAMIVIAVGLIFSIIKKMLKLAIFILSIAILLLVIIKLAAGYFGF